MVSRKKTSARKPRSVKPAKRAKRYVHATTNGSMTHGQQANGHAAAHNGDSAVPLRTQTAQALQNYFSHLNGDHPRGLYELVLREVEEPLFRSVLDYVKGNQSRAAEVLGLNRGTLRKKLREHGLAEQDDAR